MTGLAPAVGLLPAAWRGVELSSVPGAGGETRLSVAARAQEQAGINPGVTQLAGLGAIFPGS